MRVGVGSSPEDERRINSIEEYDAVVSELKDFLLGLKEFKKKRAQQYFFSMLQTLFLVFCSSMFYLLHLKIEFVPEIVLLPFYCNALKDSLYYLKEMSALRKFTREYRPFISKKVSK